MTALITSTRGYGISYDPSSGIVPLIQRALGIYNLKQLNKRITSERFPLAGIGLRTTMAWVEPYRNDEMSEVGAPRLVAANHYLGNHGDLATFLHDYPEEVARWGLVSALSEDARWLTHSQRIRIPTAFVDGTCRMYNLRDFRYKFNSSCGILVVSSPAVS